MITDDEVLRLFERADPALTDDAAPSIDAAAYLDALRTRGSDVDYLDAELTPTGPPTHRRWLAAVAVAASVAIVAGGIALAARDDDQTGVTSDTGPFDTGPRPVDTGPRPVDTGPVTEQPPVTEGPVRTVPPPPADALIASEGAGTRVGFIGLPPVGATPSSPAGVEIVVSVYACHTPGPHWFGPEPGDIDVLSLIDRLPPLGELTVLADGRLIWRKFDDLAEGANSLSTGLLEQRLTPEGVELMRSEANTALGSGEPQHCGPEGYSDVYALSVGLEGHPISGDDEHLARVMDPWSWLPAAAWEDREIKAHVPNRYLVTVTGGEISMDELAAQLPAAAVDLIDARYWEPHNGGPYAVFTTDEARAFAAALDNAGLEQNELLNAFVLDYQFESESRNAVEHITFHPVGCETDLPHPDTALGCDD